MALPYRNTKRRRSQAYILIGDGFDEYEVIYFLHCFRQQGLPIKSVSLFDKLVYSKQGVGLKADYALAERPFDPHSDCLLILPSGGQNGDRLRHDARVRSLLESVNRGSGRIVITDTQSELANDLAQVMQTPPYCARQGDQPLEDFVSSLADRMVYAN